MALADLLEKPKFEALEAQVGRILSEAVLPKEELPNRAEASAALMRLLLDDSYVPQEEQRFRRLIPVSIQDVLNGNGWVASPDPYEFTIAPLSDSLRQLIARGFASNPTFQMGPRHSTCAVYVFVEVDDNKEGIGLAHAVYVGPKTLGVLLGERDCCDINGQFRAGWNSDVGLNVYMQSSGIRHPIMTNVANGSGAFEDGSLSAGHELRVRFPSPSDQEGPRTYQVWTLKPDAETKKSLLPPTPNPIPALWRIGS